MNVAIIKYNAGNIGSVENAVKRLGIEPIVTDNVELIQSADRVIFPGQGEARSTMNYLKAHRLDEVIVNLKQPGSFRNATRRKCLKWAGTPSKT